MAETTYRLLVDWEGDGQFGHTEADIWSHATHIIASLGRDYGSQIYGRSIAGDLSVLLHDSDGLYSRTNPQSSLFGLALPRRKVQWKMQAPGEAEVFLWSGYLDSITPRPQRGEFQTVELRAVGILSLLTENEIGVPVQFSISPGGAIYQILDAAGIASADRNIDTGTTTIGTWWVHLKSEALEAMREIENTEGGFVRELPSGPIRFEDFDHRAQGLSRTSQAIFAGHTEGGINPYIPL